MQVLRDLPIRRKLTLVFGLTSLFSISIAVLAAFMLTSVSNVTNEVNSKWLPGVRTMDGMHSQHSTIRRFVLAYPLCNDDPCRAKYRSHIATARQKLTDGFQEFISRYATTPAEKAELTHLADLVEKDNQYDDAFLKELDAGNHESATHLILHESRDAYEEAYANGDAIVAEYNAGAAQATSHALSVASTSKVVILLCAGFILILSIVATQLLSSLIATPLLSAVEALEMVARKDLTAKIEARSQDEVGRLSAAVMQSINSTREVLTAMQDASDLMTDRTSEINDLVGRALEQSKTQAASINQIAAAAQEMTATIGEVSQNAEEATRASQLSARSAADAGQVMHVANETMAKIGEASSHVSERMETLARHSGEIGNVVNVIQEISEQTNLLALNAAIEAARAGEHGRGFSVVAGEVRRLAERTKSATEEITLTINRIQDETSKTTSGMEENRTAVESGLKETANAQAALNSTTDLVHNTEHMISMIATAAIEQTAAAKEIASSAMNISSTSSARTAGAEKIAQASQQLTNMASDMNRQLGAFRLK